MQHRRAFILILLCGLALGGCSSVETDPATRTARLREMYPPGVTTREDVQKAWRNNKPDWSEVRPAQGWSQHRNAYLARKIPPIEQRTGKEVARMDRYWGPDGWLGLCYCWYYYDATDHLVDVEWMYKSD